MKCELSRKHFVRFLFPDGLFCTEIVREIDERDPAKVAVPENAFCFSFYDQIVGVTTCRGEKIKVASDPIDQSSRYYYGGKIYTIEEVKELFPDELQRIRRLEGNGDTHVIICRTGNWLRLEEGDVLLKVRE